MESFSNQELKNNAEYIIKILESQRQKMWCWGASAFRYLEYEKMMSLRFRVRGLIHKGLVMVSYNGGADLFEVRIIDKEENVKEVRVGIYLDGLVDAIDELVETGNLSKEEYRQRVEKDLWSKGIAMI